MVQKLLAKAKEEFTDAIHLAYLLFSGVLKSDVQEFLQTYVVLRQWEVKLDEEIENTINKDKKLGYQDMKSVIKYYTDKCEDSFFKQNEELILAWMFTKKGLPLTEEEREIISTFVEVVERKNIDLYSKWRTFIPEL